MENLFKEHSKSIRIYTATTTLEDPYEKNVSLTELHPLSIKAIVTDLIASQITWKMPGIETDGAKEIIIEKRYRSLIEKSVKIQIDDDFFEGWKINGRMQIREEGDYCRIYLYIKKV